MNQNRTKKIIRDGGAALGTFCYFPTPWTVEIAGLAGMDFAIIDLEHAGKDLLLVEAMVVAAELYGMTAIVRVPSADEKHILQVLETGCQGIMVPLVDSAETATRAVAAAKYPPQGVRGVCRSTRAAKFGVSIPRFAEFAQTANDEIMVIAMIEERNGVENIKEILTTGVDGIVLGPADLSGSYGVMGNLEHSLVRDALERVTEAVVAHDSTWMGHLVFSPDQVEHWLKKGHRFFCYGVDTQILALTYQKAAEGARARIAAHLSPATPIAARR
jgi:4-hydroxy-2-oxoheptanedioate aldolase